MWFGSNRIFILREVKRPDDIIFGDEITRLSEGLKIFISYRSLKSRPNEYDGACGFITRQVLREVLKNIEDKSFFICGPQGLYDFCLPQVEDLGSPKT